VTVAVPLVEKDVLVSELQLSPEGAVALSVNVLANPWMRPTVMVDLDDDPALTFEGEDAAIVKSGGIPNVKEAVVV
jgi:hypothetical protein